MKKLFWTSMLLLFSTARTASADVSFGLRSGTFLVTGQTSYDITFSGFSTLIVSGKVIGNFNGESKLEFNLNADMLDIGGDIIMGRQDFIVSLDFASSFAGNSQIFRDRDWIYNPIYDPAYGILWGDTTSTGIETPCQIFCLGLKKSLVSFGPENGSHLNLKLGWENQHWGVLYIYNYAGFYGPYFTHNGTTLHVDENSSTPILTYEISYNDYSTGLDLDSEISRGFHAGFGADIGRSDFSDTDHHFIGDRIMQGMGGGFYADLDCDLAFDLGGGFSLTDYGQYKNFSPSGIQTQNYYSGIFPVSAVVNDQVNSDQFRVGLELSFIFNAEGKASRPGL